MPLTGKKLNYNDWKERAGSKLSKQAFVTKPENRQIGTKVATPEKANAILKKEF